MEIKFNQIRQGVTYRGLNNNYSLLYKAVYKGSNWWLMLCCNMDTEVCTSVFMTEKIWNDGCEKCFEEPQTYNNHYFDLKLKNKTTNNIYLKNMNKLIIYILLLFQN